MGSVFPLSNAPSQDSRSWEPEFPVVAHLGSFPTPACEPFRVTPIRCGAFSRAKFLGPVPFESLNATPATDAEYLRHLAAAPCATGGAVRASAFASLRLQERHVAKVVRAHTHWSTPPTNCSPFGSVVRRTQPLPPSRSPQHTRSKESRERGR